MFGFALVLYLGTLAVISHAGSSCASSVQSVSGCTRTPRGEDGYLIPHTSYTSGARTEWPFPELPVVNAEGRTGPFFGEYISGGKKTVDFLFNFNQEKGKWQLQPSLFICCDYSCFPVFSELRINSE